MSDLSKYYRTSPDGRIEYIGPFRSLEEMPAPAPLPPALCVCGARLDAAGTCTGCGVIGNCQCRVTTPETSEPAWAPPPSWGPDDFYEL